MADMLSCNVCEKGWVNLGDRYRRVSKCGCGAAYRLPPVCRRRRRVLRCRRAGCTSHRPARCAQSCRAATTPTCLSPVVHPRTPAGVPVAAGAAVPQLGGRRLRHVRARRRARAGDPGPSHVLPRVQGCVHVGLDSRRARGSRQTERHTCRRQGAPWQRGAPPRDAVHADALVPLRLPRSLSKPSHPPSRPGFCPDTWNAAAVCRTCAQLGCPRACAAGAGCRRCPRGSVRLHTTPPLGLGARQWHGYCTGLRPAPFEPVPKLPAICLRAKEVRHRVPGRSPARPPAAWQPCAVPCSVSASGMMLH